MRGSSSSAQGYRREVTWWIISRSLLVAVCVALPVLRACTQIKTAPLREAHRKCMEAYAEADKYPVLSEGWYTNKAAGDHWLAEAQKLREKYYGKEP